MYSKYVQIVINNNSKSTDRLYTYGVLEQLEEKVAVGKRAKIEFGRNRKTLEGIILNVSYQNSLEDKKIKPVIDVLDDEPIIKKELIKLAFWIRERYVCRYIEAVKLMFPSNLKYEQKIIIKLNDNVSRLNLTKKELKVIDIIDNKSIDINIIKKQYKSNDLYSIIDKLENKNIINVNIIETTGKNKRTIKVVELVDVRNCIEDYNLNNARKQFEIIKYLLDNKKAKLSDIMQHLNASLSSFKSLEKKGFIEIFEKSIINYKPKKIVLDTKKVLNTEQLECFKNIIDSKEKAFLLHGVTGSGKTEIYMQLIEKYLNINMQAIVLVPEISLTPQTIERFEARFGNRIAVYHSKLTPREKYEQWERVLQGKADIVIGARSALFAPVKNLGIIIIDEEHEESYKSSSTPKYDAVEVAIKRAYIENCKVVLGSATPSVRTYYLAKRGYLKLLEIKNRVREISMPEIKIIDMREELSFGNKSFISKQLYNDLCNVLNRKEQAILFLNRRGYSNFVLCKECGNVIKCSKCDISMTYHADKKLLICHYCGRTQKIASTCSNCGSSSIKQLGIGTQQVEILIKKLFPQANVRRMDFDTMTEKDSYSKIYKDFKKQKIDILIGTQMLAKGLDFPNVTLVGVISADTSLNLPFYNANEKTYQLLTQVSGRAGRGNKKGRVYIQTYEPEHFTIEAVKDNSYDFFINKEIILRKEFAYPPFIDIINISTISKYEDSLKKISTEKYFKIKNILKNLIEKRMVLLYKPIPNSVYKINDEYRMNVYIKSSKKSTLNVKKAVREVYLNEDIKNIKISINFNNILL